MSVRRYTNPTGQTRPYRRPSLGITALASVILLVGCEQVVGGIDGLSGGDNAVPYAGDISQAQLQADVRRYAASATIGQSLALDEAGLTAAMAEAGTSGSPSTATPSTTAAVPVETRAAVVSAPSAPADGGIAASDIDRMAAVIAAGDGTAPTDATADAVGGAIAAAAPTPTRGAVDSTVMASARLIGETVASRTTQAAVVAGTPQPVVRPSDELAPMPQARPTAVVADPSPPLAQPAPSQQAPAQPAAPPAQVAAAAPPASGSLSGLGDRVIQGSVIQGSAAASAYPALADTPAAPSVRTPQQRGLDRQRLAAQIRASQAVPIESAARGAVPTSPPTVSTTSRTPVSVNSVYQQALAQSLPTRASAVPPRANSLLPASIPTSAANAPAISVLEDSVFFASGASTLAPAEARKLDALVHAAWAQNARLRVIGFASATGSGSSIDRRVRNFNISMDRANLVASLLIQSGLSASAVAVEARGEDQQVSVGGTEAFSRRADIYFEY